MAKISEQSIEKVRSSADIVDVVSGYVQLKRKGRNFFGLCPFHGEKTGSFSVNDQKQIFHCFGCGVGGGVINFIMQIEKLEFVEAVHFLADKYNVKLEISGSSRPRELISQLREIHEVAAKHFQDNLKTTAGEEVLQYFEDRGLTRKTISGFRLGYSDSGWKTLLDHLRSEEFSAEAMNQCGLFISGDKGYFDRFRSRIIFPLQNTQGKMVGFAGRVFKGDEPAKYINSPETPLYNKSRILYGLWASKPFIKENEPVLVVEGYMDFLQLFQAGIKNLVAVSGTAFTDGHARELRKYSRNVALTYDGDKAGVSAAIRAGYVLLRNGLNPKIVEMPINIDPDDWVKQSGPEPILESVKNARDLLSFQFEKAAGEKQDPTVKAAFVNSVLQEFSIFDDRVLRELYVKRLAEIVDINDDTLFASLDNLLQRRRQRLPKADRSSKTETLLNPGSQSQLKLQDELLQLCFSEDQDIRILIYKHMKADWLTSASSQRIFEAVFIHLPSAGAPDANTIIDRLSEETDRRRLSALLMELDKINITKAVVTDCLIRLEKKFIESQLEVKRQELKNTVSGDTKFSQLLTEMDILQRKKKNIGKEYRAPERGKELPKLKIVKRSSPHD